MENKYPLSIVTLTKNSSDKIRDCLQSVSWCDDIVILDDLSTDNTLEIVKEYTSRIYQRKWENEGIHRNYAYSLAKNEYILSLDSDERVSPELKDELITLIQAGFTYNGYNIPHRNFIGKTWIRHGGWYPNKKCKLFKKSEFRYAEEEHHPPAIMKGDRKDLNGEIIHLAYKNYSDFVRKLNLQTDYEAIKWARDKRKMSLGKMLWKTFDRFFRAYFRKAGFKDGFLGFMLAFFGSFYQLLSYAKYMEIMNEKQK